MMELLDILASPAFWTAVLRIATPLILGTLGVLLCERAGVLNLGIEGIMVAGAFSGWLAVYLGWPLWAGVGVAALTGGAVCVSLVAIDGLPRLPLVAMGTVGCIAVAVWLASMLKGRGPGPRAPSR